MAAAVRAGGQSLESEYERYRELVLAMLGKRFPRFDEDERLAIYHDAWVRLLSKRERGEEIDNVRAYLLATCAAEALHVVSRNRRPLPVDPSESLFADLPDDRPDVEEQVVVRDQVRLARSLLDALDERQRDVLKLRWDLQLNGAEIRAALGLSRRQYQRLGEEGAAAIAEKVTELESGAWSRRQRSLLTACLVSVGEGDERRAGIASARQREEAQRLLETDPHFAALYAEIRQALRRAAAFLPLPVIVRPDRALSTGRVAELLGDARHQVSDIADTAKRQATSIYIRAADPTLLSSPRPGTAVASVAACIAIGGGAFGAYDAVSKAPTPVPPTTIKATPDLIKPHIPNHPRIPLPKRRRKSPRAVPSVAPTAPPAPAIDPSQIQTQPATSPPDLSARPTPPATSEFSFEN